MESLDIVYENTSPRILITPVYPRALLRECTPSASSLLSSNRPSEYDLHRVSTISSLSCQPSVVQANALHVTADSKSLFYPGTSSNTRGTWRDCTDSVS